MTKTKVPVRRLSAPIRDRAEFTDTPIRSVRECADFTGLTGAAIRDLIEREAVRAVRVGRVWRVSTKSLMECIDGASA